ALRGHALRRGARRLLALDLLALRGHLLRAAALRRWHHLARCGLLALDLLALLRIGLRAALLRLHALARLDLLPQLGRQLLSGARLRRVLVLHARAGGCVATDL